MRKDMSEDYGTKHDILNEIGTVRVYDRCKNEL